MDIESKENVSEDSTASSSTIAIFVESHKNKIKGLIVSLILALLLKINIGDNDS